ncbi:hypothetical protein LZ554_004431 [Drepanopeziza brunnea f. sp. 'monogermtubi']|nr:hypothetical protein LZ554_004431 [Drepanopeziza brunnea f. sp. 'monogermtubi']
MASTSGRNAMFCLNHGLSCLNGESHCSAQFLPLGRNGRSWSTIEITTAPPSYTDEKSVNPSSSCSGKPSADSSKNTPFYSIDPSPPRIFGLPLNLAKWFTCGLATCFEGGRREKKVAKALRSQHSYTWRLEPPPTNYYKLREASLQSVSVPGYEIRVESGAVTVAAAAAAGGSHSRCEIKIFLPDRMTGNR